MALTYKATFRPEKRRDKLTGDIISENVPLMLDLSYRGRCWYNTGFRLSHINDYDVEAQKMKSGKKALKNKMTVSATNVNSELDAIKGHISEAFSSLKVLKEDITAKILIETMKASTGNDRTEIVKEMAFHEEFSLSVERWYQKGIIGLQRKKHYTVLLNILGRFLSINKLNITSKEVTPDILVSFQDFQRNEHLYVDTHPQIYDDLPLKKLPQKERSQNTVATSMKKLRAFFNELEETDKIPVNPFRKIAKKERCLMMKETYNEPVYLAIDEIQTILNGDCPESLQRAKDCFLLQCAIGCRIEDFNSLSWDNIETKHGFYHVHYVPSKTSRNSDLKPIDTPLVKFAADIIEKHKNKLPNLLAPIYKGNVYGKEGLNVEIKKLLKHYKIERKAIFRDKGTLKSMPICDIASSKTARSTHVDIITKSQIDKYAAGLHRRGSKAIERYTSLTLKDRFKLYSIAFKQPEYKL